MSGIDLYKDIIVGVLSKREVRVSFSDLEIDTGKVVEMESYKALQKIKAIIEDDSLSDFDCIEEIVCVLESVGSSGGGRHDFG